MNWLIDKPFIPFLILIPIVVLIGLLKRYETLDINIHDTYFVINNLHLAFLLSIILGIIALGYFLTNIYQIQLIKWLTISHASLSIIGTICVYILFHIERELNLKTNNIEFFLKYSKTIQRLDYTMISILIITIFAQLLFLINLVVGFVKK